MNGSEALREEIRSLLPDSDVALERAQTAVVHIPESKLLYYRNELADPIKAAGIAHELRLLGELLHRGNSLFECRPFDPTSRCDALLLATGTAIELEITALVAPAAAAAVARVCRRVEQYLRERFAGLFFRVDLGNLWWAFPANGDGTIDEDALYAACVCDLDAAINPRGIPDPSWREERRSETRR